MKLLYLTAISLCFIPVPSTQSSEVLKQEPVPYEAPKPKPIIHNFMVTDCVNHKCLMKMKPFRKVINDKGEVTWVRIQ